MWPASNINTEHWIFSELSWWTLHLCCPKSLLEEISTSCVIPLGKNSWNLVPGFLQTLSYQPFPLRVFSFVFFTVINHSLEDNYVLNNVSYPTSESLILRGWYRGPLKSHASEQILQSLSSLQMTDAQTSIITATQECPYAKTTQPHHFWILICKQWDDKH